jgi:hypothetical protein
MPINKDSRLMVRNILERMGSGPRIGVEGRARPDHRGDLSTPILEMAFEERARRALATAAHGPSPPYSWPPEQSAD